MLKKLKKVWKNQKKVNLFAQTLISFGDMKFTKEDAYKELVAKLTANGEKLNLSERSVNEMLDTLMPLLTNDETELTDFAEKVVPLCKTADSNVRHDVSVGIADFKKNNPTQTPPPPPTKKDGEGDVNEELIKRIGDLENKIKANEKKEAILLLKSNFLAKAKEKGVTDESWLNDYVDAITIGEDFDVDAKADACLKLYNKSLATVKSGVNPKQTGGGGNDDKYLSSVLSAVAAMSKED